jgi:hypothetical protein
VIFGLIQIKGIIMINKPYYNKTRSVHSGRIERWLGADKIERLSDHMINGGGPGIKWYGPPINLSDCPGSVWITGDGDFIGNFDRGFFDSAADSLGRHIRNLWKNAGKPIYFNEHQASPSFGVGFASIGDALLQASSGNRQTINGVVAKTGPTGVVASASSLWRVGAMPAAGSASIAAPGGRALVKANTGAMAFTNPSTGTLHLTGADFSASIINNAVMLYDRIYDVVKTMNSAATESVTGVPTRYQSSTATDANYAGGNFLFIEVGGTALAATAHNWTTCLYRDQDGNDSQTLPSVTGISGAIVDRFDMPVNTWFCPLATGDTGIMDLAQMQCSATVATGAINFVIGHPIGIMSFPVINSLLPFDWLTNRDQAPRIFDDAALALFELPKPATNATTYNGIIYATRAAP